MIYPQVTRDSTAWSTGGSRVPELSDLDSKIGKLKQLLILKSLSVIPTIYDCMKKYIFCECWAAGTAF